MSSLSKGLRKVQVTLKWDPSPIGAASHDLDIVAATYTADAPHGAPAYLVHFDSRSPDGTITLDRDSRTGQGFGADEVMTLELERLASAYARVVVGVVIQQPSAEKTFSDIPNTGTRILDGPVELASDDLSGMPDASAATIAEFTRDESGAWRLRPVLRGFTASPAEFAELMGAAPA
ncbi:TerD family protein [Streptomyces tirandamycinicus]|uniref:TerD-family protein n=1 Tax=Streptomyces tirandamycinicus TaxID=2174846 RepID=A0A2S1SYR7_9ACTN|nr:TerD family protein [Streptomyces tirandamycinicus]AWI31377.1 TerD-family protein [Streptomyces tirandamycinicus]